MEFYVFTADDLISETTRKTDHNFNGPDGVTLLNNLVIAGFIGSTKTCATFILSNRIFIFLHRPFFIVFAISNGINLFSSSTSLTQNVNFVPFLSRKMIYWPLHAVFIDIAHVGRFWCSNQPLSILIIYRDFLFHRLFWVRVFLRLCLLQFPLLYEMRASDTKTKHKAINFGYKILHYTIAQPEEFIEMEMKAATVLVEREELTTPLSSLYKAVLNKEWDVVRESIENGTANANPLMFSLNVIHVLVTRGHDADTRFLSELVNDPRLDPNVLLQTDHFGKTALFLAAMTGNIWAATTLVDKNPALLTIHDYDSKLPVHVAAENGHWIIVNNFIYKTLNMIYLNLNGPDGAYLLNTAIISGGYGLALSLSLLDNVPELAYVPDMFGTTALETLATYFFLHTNRNKVSKREQERAVKLLKHLCQGMRDYALSFEDRSVSEVLWKPLLRAAKLGVRQIVVEIINTVPDIIWFTDDKKLTIYHYAVLNRHENIFNLIWNWRSTSYRVAKLKGDDGSNILHLAAKLGATTTSQVSGAALQMQRELQWYKEIEKRLPHSLREELDANGMTPGMVFTNEHKGLIKEGEKWMKTTASSCTVVAALIVTVVFAAAFTVPGGIDSSGIPIFLNKPFFIVFSISNAMGLFSSSTSLMMFLGILNSRYSEIDFLHSLPKKMIIGLCTLFLSILCMLVAFGATLNLYLNHLSRFALIPIILGTSVPAILFAMLQFPLLYKMGYSTYGPSIFRPEVNLDLAINASPTYLPLIDLSVCK